jgi:tetratricopeptide (TPR) repeat protein
MRRAVIKNFLEVDAAKAEQPLALVFDDLQFGRDDTLDLIAYLVENLRGPVIVVCLGRGELLARRESWRRLGGERHAIVELGPLGDADSATVMRELLAPCGDAPGVGELVDEAVTISGGNPGLLEQMLRIYRDAGVLEVPGPGGDARWIVHAEKLDQVQVPLTIQDAVQARIAALAPEERGLLEKAAALGGVFWLGALVAMRRYGEPPPEIWEGTEAEDVALVRQLLADLVERDYVLRLPDSSFAGDEEYVFKHNLEREALARLIPPEGARLYHRAIAEWLAFRESVEASEETLEMLARHREKAGAIALSATSYLQAADIARSRYANAKATELYAKGLSLFDSCDHADGDLRLRALHHYGDVLQSLGRNDEAYGAFTEMLTRAWRLDLKSKGGAAHSRIGRLYRETGRLEEASRHLSAALALFGQAQDDRGIASTLDDIGKLHWLRGEYAPALDYTLRSLAMRRKMGDRRSIALSLNNLGLVHQDSGNYKGALEAFEQALRIRRDIGDAVGVSVTLNNLGLVAQDARDDQRALALFQEAYDVAKETGDRNRIALLLTNLGETHNRLGDSAKAIAMLKQAEDLADELGDRLGLAEAVRGLGKAYLAQREYTRARECAQRAVDLFAETDSKVQLGVALRSFGEIVAAASAAGGEAPREAAEHLKRSIAIFEEIGNEVELARSSRSYAELLRQSPEHATNPAIVAEARLLAKRAEEIFARMRTAGGGLAGDPLLAK